MLRVWEACRKSGRPQHVFRSMLRAGLIAMVESGDMPESVIEECGLDSLVERRRRRVSRHTDKAHAVPAPMPQPMPQADPYAAPYPPRYPQYPAYPAPYPHDPEAYAPPPVPHAPPAPPRHIEEERRPAPPAEVTPPRFEEQVTQSVKAPEPQQEKPIIANPLTGDGESKPARKLGKLM